MQRSISESTFWGGTAMALATLVACAGSTTGDATQAAPVPESQLMDRMVAAYCEGLGVCCQSRGLAFSATGCDAGLREANAGSASICEPGTTYDAQAAGTCLEQAQSYIASCGSAGTPPPAVCNRMCVGTLPVGAACQSTEQCAQPASGQVDCSFTTSAQGTCTPAVRGQLGESCRASCSLSGDCTYRTPVPIGGDAGVPGNALCYAEDGLYCASDSICQRLGGVGGACEGLDTCMSGAYCGTAGVCEAKKAAGAACTTYDECLGGCDSATGRCVGDNGLAVTAELCAGNFGASSTDTASAPTGG
jgi:hypothetical protein